MKKYIALAGLLYCFCAHGMEITPQKEKIKNALLNLDELTPEFLEQYKNKFPQNSPQFQAAQEILNDFKKYTQKKVQSQQPTISQEEYDILTKPLTIPPVMPLLPSLPQSTQPKPVQATPSTTGSISAIQQIKNGILSKTNNQPSKELLENYLNNYPQNDPIFLAAQQLLQERYGPSQSSQNPQEQLKPSPLAQTQLHQPTKPAQPKIDRISAIQQIKNGILGKTNNKPSKDLLYNYLRNYPQGSPIFIAAQELLTEHYGSQPVLPTTSGMSEMGQMKADILASTHNKPSKELLEEMKSNNDPNSVRFMVAQQLLDEHYPITATQPSYLTEDAYLLTAAINNPDQKTIRFSKEQVEKINVIKDMIESFAIIGSTFDKNMPILVPNTSPEQLQQVYFLTQMLVDQVDNVSNLSSEDLCKLININIILSVDFLDIKGAATLVNKAVDALPHLFTAEHLQQESLDTILNNLVHGTLSPYGQTRIIETSTPLIIEKIRPLFDNKIFSSAKKHSWKSNQNRYLVAANNIYLLVYDPTIQHLYIYNTLTNNEKTIKIKYKIDQANNTHLATISNDGKFIAYYDREYFNINIINAENNTEYAFKTRPSKPATMSFDVSNNLFLTSHTPKNEIICTLYNISNQNITSQNSWKFVSKNIATIVLKTNNNINHVIFKKSDANLLSFNDKSQLESLRKVYRMTSENSEQQATQKSLEDQMIATFNKWYKEVHLPETKVWFWSRTYTTTYKTLFLSDTMQFIVDAARTTDGFVSSSSTYTIDIFDMVPGMVQLDSSYKKILYMLAFNTTDWDPKKIAEINQIFGIVQQEPPSKPKPVAQPKLQRSFLERIAAEIKAVMHLDF